MFRVPSRIDWWIFVLNISSTWNSTVTCLPLTVLLETQKSYSFIIKLSSSTVALNCCTRRQHSLHINRGLYLTLYCNWIVLLNLDSTFYYSTMCRSVWNLESWTFRKYGFQIKKSRNFCIIWNMGESSIRSILDLGPDLVCAKNIYNCWKLKIQNSLNSRQIPVTFNDLIDFSLNMIHF